MSVPNITAAQIELLEEIELYGTPRLLNNYSGAQLCGGLACTLSLGILLAQAWTYFGGPDRKHDPLGLKFYAFLFLVAVMVDDACILFGVYNALVLNGSSIVYQLTSSWSVQVATPFIGWMFAALQCFYLWRIRVLSEHKWLLLPCLSLVFTVAGTAMATWTGVWLGTQATAANIHHMAPQIWAWYACHACSDVITTNCLSYLLIWKPRPGRPTVSLKTGAKELATRLIQTNALSLIMQTLTTATYFSSDKVGNYTDLFGYAIANVYCFSMFYSLNMREGYENTWQRKKVNAQEEALAPTLAKDIESGGVVEVDEEKSSQA